MFQVTFKLSKYFHPVVQHYCISFCCSGCFHRIYGATISDGGFSHQSENRPTTFWFGNYGDDTDGCANACRSETSCVGFVHVRDVSAGGVWRGHCYGVGETGHRSFVYYDHINSGLLGDCGQKGKYSWQM